VADTFGNTLAANFPWMFTTSHFNPCPPPVAAVALGAACGYGVLADSIVTNTGNHNWGSSTGYRRSGTESELR
jgi:hypothetical protein